MVSRLLLNLQDPALRVVIVGSADLRAAKRTTDISTFAARTRFSRSTINHPARLTPQLAPWEVDQENLQDEPTWNHWVWDDGQNMDRREGNLN